MSKLSQTSCQIPSTIRSHFEHFFPWMNAVVLWSRDNLLSIVENPLLVTSCLEKGQPSLAMTLLHLSFHIRCTDSIVSMTQCFFTSVLRLMRYKVHHSLWTELPARCVTCFIHLPWEKFQSQLTFDYHSHIKDYKICLSLKPHALVRVPT